VVAVGDIVKVRVIGIDKGRERVSLSMRDIFADASIV
jgi:protein Tex